ncbi:MAG: ribosomal subunit interface protein [Betaproteobacteria bacterium]|nr:ribosomal subunit interface protein [Betaproteobacteria bacterium]
MRRMHLQVFNAADWVQPHRVHRGIYTDPAIFALEQQRIFERAWIYIGHESELPEPGDHILAHMGTQEIVLVRQGDGNLAAFENRCSHRGARLVMQDKGQARQFTCAYHAWSFHWDGRLQALPLPQGYGSDAAPPSRDLVRIRQVQSYRGFVFATHSADAQPLNDFLGGLASALDNMVDRSPSGQLVQAGGKLRMLYHGNWKLFMENAVDLVHPMFVHGGAVMVARQHPQWGEHAGTTGQTTQMLLANGLKLSEWDGVDLHAHDGGHVYMGGFYRQGVIAPKRQDPVFTAYQSALEARHGGEKTQAVLAVERFNNLIWPNLSVNARFQTVRMVQPLAVDKTMVTSYCFAMTGAPPEMHTLSLRFLNTASSPASLVASDDLEIFERCQQGLSEGLNDWIDTARGLGHDQAQSPTHWRANGTSELPIRHQLQAWLHWMGHAP